jgi:uncharacterized protein (TIGR02391 family)
MSNQKTRVVASYSDGSLALECGFCSGSGFLPETAYGEGPSSDSCTVCSGFGFNILRGDSEGWMDCSRCDGSGRSWEDGYFFGGTCAVCGGRGFIDLSAAKRAAAADELEDAWSIMHPDVVKVAKSRFESGHYADAVEAAFKHFNQLVKRAAGDTTHDGADLMWKTFSTDAPLLVLDDLATESGRNVQNGYMHMFAGAMIGIRNPKAHENLVIDAVRAVHLLFVASLFCFKLDEVKGRIT